MILEGKCGAFNPVLLDALKELQQEIDETLRKGDAGDGERVFGSDKEIVRELEINY